MDEPKKNIIVLQADEGSNKPRKWTFKAYRKGVVFGKWAILASTVVLGVGGYLGFRFILNPLRETVSSSFSYNLGLTYDGAGSGTFVNGSVFNYGDLFSQETLTAVKDSDPAFAKINIDDLGSSLSITLRSYQEADGPIRYYTPYVFNLSAKLKPFGNASVAKAFVKALAETTKTRSDEAVKEYEVENAIPSVFSSLEFEDQIDLLEKQYSIIGDKYTALITDFGAETIVAIGETKETLSNLSKEFSYAFREGTGTAFSQAKGSLLGNNYLNFVSGEETKTADRLLALAQNDISIIKDDLKTIQLYDTELKELQSSTVVVTSSEYAERIAFLSYSITELKSKQTKLLTELNGFGYDLPTDDPAVKEVTLDNVSEIKLSTTKNGRIQMLRSLADGTASESTIQWRADCQDFRANLASLKEKLVTTHRDTVTTAYRNLYLDKRSSVNFTTAGVISTSGHLSNAIGVLGGVVLGFALSSLICTGVLMIREEKAAKPKEE